MQKPIGGLSASAFAGMLKPPIWILIEIRCRKRGGGTIPLKNEGGRSLLAQKPTNTTLKTTTLCFTKFIAVQYI